MAVNIELLPLVDFTGGLDFRANGLQLRAGESPDMMNVDVDPRGGFAMRNVMTSMNTTQVASVADSIWSYSTTGGIKQVLISRSIAGPDCEILSSTGTNFTAIATPAAHTTGGRHRAVTFDDVGYIQNGTNKAMTYDGTTLAELTDPVVGATWDPDFASPTTGEMPIAKYIAVHQGSVFVANTKENGTAFPNRVRWSHPGHAQAWRSQDFIDVDTGADGDVITAILSFGERLLVFKNKSLHMISGYSPANFQVSALSQRIGAPSQEAVCASEDAVYFFNWPYGAYRYTSRNGLEWLFERLYPAITDGHILGASTAAITSGFINQRAWFSVVYASGTTNNRVYVFDPTLSGPAVRGRTASTRANGAWVQYDSTIGPMLAWGPPGSTTSWLAAHATEGWVLKLEQVGDHDAWGYEYLLMDGVDDRSTTPDSAALSITGDLDISCRAAPTNWLPTTINTLVSKWTTTGNQRAYMLQIVNATGKLRLSWSTNGTAVTSKDSTVATGLVNDEPSYVRATLDVDNGATGNTVTFYTSQDGVGWTVLGAPVVTSGVTSIADTTSVVSVGIQTLITDDFTGNFYSARIASGIGPTQTVVASPDWGNSAVTTATTTTDTQGNVWTNTGATLSGGPKARQVPSYYLTKWEDLDNPAMKKRWKRPEIIFEQVVSTTLTVQVFKDYDPATAASSFILLPSAGDTTDLSLWGTDWGTMIWGSAESAKSIGIQKGSAFGRCRSVALKIVGPATSTRWAVQGITLKYVPQRIRS